MTDARRLQLLHEILHGQDTLTDGSSDAERAVAMAKLYEWQRLAERSDIVLVTAFRITADGPRLKHATAAVTSSGRAIVSRSRRRTPA